jgi:putative endonuclease
MSTRAARPDAASEHPCVTDVTLQAVAALGRAGEDAAAAHLIGVHGLELVTRNWRIALDELRGELDLVLRDPGSGTLVVCEVKSRTRAATRDGAAATLGPRQQARIRRLTGVFLASGAVRPSRVRFDLVALDLGAQGRRGTARLTHLADAW